MSDRLSEIRKRVDQHECEGISADGAEGPVSKLGREPHIWKCGICGLVYDSDVPYLLRRCEIAENMLRLIADKSIPMIWVSAAQKSNEALAEIEALK